MKEDSSVRAATEVSYSPKERKKVIAAAGLGWGLEFFDLTLVALLVVPIASTFGVGLAEMGAVFTAQLIATGVGGIVFGRLADLYGRKRVLTWTIWVFGLATAACALAPSFAIFLVLRVITGFGVGGEWAVGFALLNEAWVPKRRGLAGGAVQAAIWPAYAVAIFLTSVIDEWRIVFAIGALPVVAAIWIRRTCPESKQWLALQRGEVEERELVVAKQPSALRQLFSGENLKALIVGTIVVFGAQYSYYVYSSWMPTYLKSDLGLEPGAAQTVLYASAAVSFFSYILAGAVSDSYGRRRTLLAFATVQLGALVTFVVLNMTDGSTSYIVISYLAISFGLGYFAIFGAWFGELFATPIRASGSSFCYSVGRGMASFGPFLVGFFAAGNGLAGGISTAVIAVLIMMVFATLLRDRSGRTITAVQ